ncbi:MAG: FecR domain-containing protein [Bacteroidota bacterium]|nr:FecR domain-containing protein [Bacteroidota bacterium]
MDKIKNYTDKEWEKLSALLSGEQNDDKDLLSRFMADDSHNTIKTWKELKEMNSQKEINVDRAWNNLYSRLRENGLVEERPVIGRSLAGRTWLRIAAVAVILLGFGTALIYLTDRDILSRNTIIATSENEKNLQVTLPDGSNIILNRDTRLSYRANFGKHGRNVTLSGEAFFDVTHDKNHPFTIDAGKANVKVLGTSFNVITNNPESEVEVYVKTGQVMVSSSTGSQNLVLDPGYVGKVNSKTSQKEVNKNQNYLSWNTGHLEYNGQTLDVVFRDLKRVYNMDIVADNPNILKMPWTAPIDNEPQETIIRLICANFNLSYTKDGNVYHLAEK